jgi:translation initiation factor 5A
MMVDDEPCRVISMDKSKPGKHGAAKARIIAVGFFSGRKKDVTMPADRMVDVPVIDKRSATVIADLGENYQLMDAESFETYELPKPTDPEIVDKIQLNVEVEVWEIMGKRAVTRVK